MNPLKELITKAVDRLGGDLEQLSHRIHDNPELGYAEVKAAAWLTEFLDAQGFKVERGVAGVETYTNVAMLRQQVRPDARIHGIITHGGAAPNIIPEFAAAVFYVRSIDLDYMWALQKRVIACAEAAAKATGATLKIVESPDNVYEPMKRNAT